jgi:hypothetical protein
LLGFGGWSWTLLGINGYTSFPWSALRAGLAVPVEVVTA